MSSELNTQKTETAPQVPSIFINGKEYKQNELSGDCLNAIAVRQELQARELDTCWKLRKLTF